MVEVILQLMDLVEQVVLEVEEQQEMDFQLVAELVEEQAQLILEAEEAVALGQQQTEALAMDLIHV